MNPPQPLRDEFGPPRSSNKLLAALPPDEYQRLVPRLKPGPLRFKQVVQKQGDKVHDIYFPGGGICSIVTAMTDGRMVDVAVVGSEGMIGITSFLGDDIWPCDALMRIPDEKAQAMSIAAFKAEMDRHGPLHAVVSRYSQAFTLLLMQLTACNSLHAAEDRCCRSLLLMHDRIGHDEFPLTQDCFSVMLGLRRPTVTLLMGRLYKAGLIEHSHRRIKILNRNGLEAASCECYGAIKAHFDRLLPTPVVSS